MENRGFYLKMGAAGLASVLAASALILGTDPQGIASAACILLAALLIRSAEKSSRKTGRTDRMKALIRGMKPGAELLLVSAALVSYSPSTAVAVSVIGLVAFSEIISSSINEEEFFGQELRVALLVLALLGLSMNSYVLFYGLLAVGLVALSDSAYMLYRSFSGDM